MENSLPREIRDILKKLITDIETLKFDLQSNTPCENDRFDEDDFWKKLVDITQAVSHEVTKLCMVFNDPPLPTNEECQTLADSIEHVTKDFVSMYLGFPDAKGKVLRSALFQFVSLVVYAVEDLCNVMEASNNDRLKLIGNVWQNCKAVHNLPQNNKDAVLEVFQTETLIIQDARDELQDAIQNQTEGQGEEEIRHAFMQNGIRIPLPNRWNETDRNVVHLSLKLVEVFSTCLKRTSKCIEEKSSDRDDHAIAQLDEAGNLVKCSSALVDDLVSSLYPPTSHSAVLHYASELKNKTSDLLTLLEGAHFSSQVDCLFANLFRDAAEAYLGQIQQQIVDD